MGKKKKKKEKKEIKEIKRQKKLEGLQAEKKKKHSRKEKQKTESQKSFCTDSKGEPEEIGAAETVCINEAAPAVSGSGGIHDQTATDIFRALGDESRMQILRLLRERELCGAELLRLVSIVQSTLSHHMKILTEAGLVRCRKQGNRTYYTIDRGTFRQVERYCRDWGNENG